MDLSQTSGDRLRKARLQRGLTAEDVHAATGISRTTLWRWEAGKIGRIPVSDLARLADLYGVSLDMIWYGERQRRPAQQRAEGEE
jgi:transcriptional regulator with XRE-family HTH domain